MSTEQLHTTAAMIAWQNELAALICAKVTAEFRPEFQLQTRTLEDIRTIQRAQAEQVDETLAGLRRRFGLWSPTPPSSPSSSDSPKSSPESSTKPTGLPAAG